MTWGRGVRGGAEERAVPESATFNLLPQSQGQNLALTVLHVPYLLALTVLHVPYSPQT